MDPLYRRSTLRPSSRIPRSRSSGRTPEVTGGRHQHQRWPTLGSVRRSQSLPRNSNAQSGLKSKAKQHRTDTRPINDKKWQSIQLQKVQKFFQLSNASHLLEKGQNLKPLSLKKFVDLYNVLMWQIDANKLVELSDYVESVPNTMALIGYPGSLTPSMMKTVNVPHVFPHVLALFAWLVSFVDICRSLTLEGILAADDAPSKHLDILLLQHLTTATNTVDHFKADLCQLFDYSSAASDHLTAKLEQIRADLEVERKRKADYDAMVIASRQRIAAIDQRTEEAARLLAAKRLALEQMRAEGGADMCKDYRGEVSEDRRTQLQKQLDEMFIHLAKEDEELKMAEMRRDQAKQNFMNAVIINKKALPDLQKIDVTMTAEEALQIVQKVHKNAAEEILKMQTECKSVRKSVKHLKIQITEAKTEENQLQKRQSKIRRENDEIRREIEVMNKTLQNDQKNVEKTRQSLQKELNIQIAGIEENKSAKEKLKILKECEIKMQKHMEEVDGEHAKQMVKMDRDIREAEDLYKEVTTRISNKLKDKIKQYSTLTLSEQKN